MIWKTTNGLGQEVTWYSEDELKKIKDIAINDTKHFADGTVLRYKSLELILQIIEGLENGQKTY